MNSVLITGGTGYFGQNFTRFLLANTQVERICIYSRSEYNQARMRASFTREENARLRFFVGDIRDVDRLTRAMRGCSVVIHAAALKRVEVGEYCPDEMVKTNVLGTMNVIEAASRGIRYKTIFLSSDKACHPTTAYGATKLIGEKLFLSAHHFSSADFVVTRYGNVAGSTGSVIPTWVEQVKAGNSIMVNDPEATRFWMTVKEACELVYWTIYNAENEIVVPTLPSFRLGDLAEAVLMKYSRNGIGLNSLTYGYGLTPGEKLHESMIGTDERFHPNGTYNISDSQARINDFDLSPPMCSLDARRMSVAELMELV